MTSTSVMDTLPLHRRLDLLARYPAGAAEARLRANLETYGPICPRPSQRRGHLPTTALLGDDGLWHLRLGPAVICSCRGRSLLALDAPMTPSTAVILHRGAPDSVSGVSTWEVKLNGAQRDPALVAPADRCPINAHDGDWDPYRSPARGNWKTLKRSRLIAVAGRMCHACRQNLGQDLEYDRHTNMIRGVLCQNCATHVIECPHPAGCWAAEYLNNSPVWHLNERYYVSGNRGDRKPVPAARAAW